MVRAPTAQPAFICSSNTRALHREALFMASRADGQVYPLCGYLYKFVDREQMAATTAVKLGFRLRQ